MVDSFVILTKENTGTLTMSGQKGTFADGDYVTEQVLVYNSPRDIACAVFCFAKRHGIMAREVQYSYRAPDGQA